jgi:hypothetical protein
MTENLVETQDAESTATVQRLLPFFLYFSAQPSIYTVCGIELAGRVWHGPDSL